MGVFKGFSLSVFSIVLISGLVGCGDEAENIVNEPLLQGRYIGPCEGLGALGVGVSVREELEFNNASDFRGVRNYFQSEDCKADTLGGAFIVEGSYQVDSDALPDSPAGAMTLEYDAAKVNPTQEWLATALSTIDFCGQDEFTVGKEVEITKGTDNFLCPVREIPETVFGAYSLDDEQLFLNPDGLSGMAITNGDRPTSLNSEKVYTKE